MFDKQPTNDEELHDQLNKEFYDNYDLNYFRHKASFLCGVIANANELLEIHARGYKIGKITAGPSELEESDTKWTKDFAKREIVINSYHSIECFFRLLFAHIENPKCPWLGLVGLKDFNSFKKRIDDLTARKYFTADHDKNLAAFLLGPRSSIDISDDEWDQSVKTMVDLVDRIGHDILSTPDYNVFKHGGALFNTELGFNMTEVIKIDKQESFVFLGSKSDKQSDKVVESFFRSYKFMKWETRFATTMLVSHLIDNLLNIHSLRLGVRKGANIHSLHTIKLDQILETGIIVDTVSESLFERHYSRPKRKKGKRK